MTPASAGLSVVPITYREACSFIERYHRHHASSRGQNFAVAAVLNDAIVGVATAGRPVSRRLDDGLTLEVNRVATDGTPNACSFLYGAVRRIGGGSWHTPNSGRPRVDNHPTQVKLRWEASA